MENINSQKLTSLLARWYELHMINKSVVAKSNEDLYPKSLKARIPAGFPGAASVYYYCDDMPRKVTQSPSLWFKVLW